MGKFILLAVLATGTIMTGATNASASQASLTNEQTAKVEMGSGTPAEQAAYIMQCSMEPACDMALLQVWEKNGGAVAMGHYVPDKQSINPMFRGTDMEKKMLEMGAINKCVKDEACRSFLVEVTKNVRGLTPDQLNQAYLAKAEFDWEKTRKNLPGQVQRNIATAVSQASSNPTPTESVSSAVPIPAGGGKGEMTGPSSGEVIDFARDADKNVTFQLVRLANGSREIQKRSPDGVKRLAGVMGHEGKWLVETTDGNMVEAVDIQLTSRGFVAGTRDKMVSYADGTGFSTFKWPVGFHTAAVQRGNVTATGYVLLERDSGGARESMVESLNIVSAMGDALGLTKRNDYMLLDLHSGRTFPINQSVSAKNVTITTGVSGCTKRNALVNVCRDVSTDRRERLYDELGMKNIRHYIWANYWLKARTGTYLIALENGTNTVSVTRLDSGEKRIAFYRGLGINDVTVTQSDDGRIKVRAKWAFIDHDIDDLEAAFAGLPIPDADKSNPQNTASAGA